MGLEKSYPPNHRTTRFPAQAKRIIMPSKVKERKANPAGQPNAMKPIAPIMAICSGRVDRLNRNVRKPSPVMAAASRPTDASSEIEDHEGTERILTSGAGLPPTTSQWLGSPVRNASAYGSFS